MENSGASSPTFICAYSADTPIIKINTLSIYLIQSSFLLEVITLIIRNNYPLMNIINKHWQVKRGERDRYLYLPGFTNIYYCLIIALYRKRLAMKIFFAKPVLQLLFPNIIHIYIKCIKKLFDDLRLF